MKEIAEQIARVAPTPTTVLIRGESGTGKELVARAIHRYSHLRDKPLITVNCTALTPTLMESRAVRSQARVLHRGAWPTRSACSRRRTGARSFSTRSGDMPLEMQGKLLRVLQAGEMQAGRRRGDPAGARARHRGHEPRPREGARGGRVPRRISSTASTRSPSSFRPFASAREDIPVLAHHFLRKAEAKVNKKVERFSPEALDLMKRYGVARQPEGAREQHRARRGARRASQVDVAHLPFDLQESSPHRGHDAGELPAWQGAGGRLVRAEAVARLPGRVPRATSPSAAQKRRDHSKKLPPTPVQVHD